MAFKFLPSLKQIPAPVAMSGALFTSRGVCRRRGTAENPGSMRFNLRSVFTKRFGNKNKIS
jgi:hypothetical protein